jgi:Domain of unknown function (DUF5655)
MAVWRCPECRREFGAVGRNHMCTPGVSVEEFLDGAPAFVEPVFRRVHAHLASIDDGGLIVDPLEKKVLFKNGPTFCIVDVKTKWLAIGFTLRRKLDSGRLSRKTTEFGGKFFHVVNVAEPDLIDDEFESWLTEAFHHGTEQVGLPGAASGSNHDPMIPDDIDFEIAPPR